MPQCDACKEHRPCVTGPAMTSGGETYACCLCAGDDECEECRELGTEGGQPCGATSNESMSPVPIADAIAAHGTGQDGSACMPTRTYLDR
jgi:hypothetical protein